MIWVYGMLLTGPVFFLILFKWTTDLATEGVGEPFWRRLRMEIWISLPGRKGDIVRITRVRKYVRILAKSGGPYSECSTLQGLGVKKNDTLKRILKDQRYQEYVPVFLPPKWNIWLMLAISFVWPLFLVILLLYYLWEWFDEKYLRPAGY